MAKNTAIFVIIGIVAIVLLGMYLQNKTGLFAISGSETMTRTGPTQVNPSQSFQVTYTAIGTSGQWGATVQESVSGGCTTDGKTSLKFAMLSDLPNPLVYTFTAPSSGTCTFTGDYQFGTMSTKNLNSYSVSVCTPATCSSLGKTCGSWSNNCGGTLSCGTCGTGQQCQSGICKTCNTGADTDCNGQVSRTELGEHINKWIANQVTRTELGQAIQAWAT